MMYLLIIDRISRVLVSYYPLVMYLLVIDPLMMYLLDIDPSDVLVNY